MPVERSAKTIFKAGPPALRALTLEKYKVPTPNLFPVVRLVVGYLKIQAPAEQWVEVYTQNTSKQEQTITVRLLVEYPNGLVSLLGTDRKKLGPQSLVNSIFRFPLGQFSGGLYKVRAVIFSSQGKVIGGSGENLLREFLVQGGHRLSERPPKSCKTSFAT